jgi:hypothetical protein
MRQTNIIILALLCLIVAPLPTLATGGIFSGDDDPIHINELNITYAVDSEAGTITMVIRAQYIGGADNFVWLIPVPDDDPVVQFDDFVRTRRLTLDFQPPPNYCEHLYSFARNYGSGGPSRDNPTTDKYEIISGDSILAWMQEHGYHYTDKSAEVMDDYVAQGMSFIALELSQASDATSGYFGSVMITYESDDLILPLRLTAFSSGPIPGGIASFYNANYHIPIDITILGNARYVPANLAHPNVDFYQILPRHAVDDVDSYENNTSSHFNYYDEVSRLLAVYDGQAFITEYAGYFSADYPYATHLHGEIAPEQMTVDPIFVPDSDMLGDLTDVNLNDYAEPLEFWGCSTRTLHFSDRSYTQAIPYDEIINNLPAGRIYKQGEVTIAYPEEWVRSEFTTFGYSYPVRTSDDTPIEIEVRVYSPETVDEETFLAYFAGEPTPPMLAMTDIYFVNDFDAPYYYTDILDLPREETQPRLFRKFIRPSEHGNATALVILTTEDDFAENEAMYRAMVDFPFTFQYYLHPDLRHTLFFNSSAFGYPEGWVESADLEGRLLITPEGMEDDLDNAPYIRVYPASDVAESPATVAPYADTIDTLKIRSGWLEDSFGIDRQEAFKKLTSTNSCIRQMDGVPFYFSFGGRTGYVYHYYGIVVEISAPDALYEEYADLIEIINEASIMQVQRACG